MRFAPTACRKSSSRAKSASTCSMGCVSRNEENHRDAMRMPRRSSSRLSSAGSVGYLFPISQPVKPASAISLTVWRKVFSPPSSGMSSLHQPIGAMPRKTLLESNMGISPLGAHANERERHILRPRNDRKPCAEPTSCPPPRNVIVTQLYYIITVAQMPQANVKKFTDSAHFRAPSPAAARQASPQRGRLLRSAAGFIAARQASSAAH